MFQTRTIIVQQEEQLKNGLFWTSSWSTWDSSVKKFSQHFSTLDFPCSTPIFTGERQQHDAAKPVTTSNVVCKYIQVSVLVLSYSVHPSVHLMVTHYCCSQNEAIIIHLGGYHPSRLWGYIDRMIYIINNILVIIITHRIHVWYIYLHLVDFYGQCT